MKKLILFVLCVIALPSLAQITITGDQFLQGYAQTQTASKSYSSTDLSGLAALIAKAGANQTWDFGGRTYVQDNTSTTGTFELLVFPGEVPLANDPDFATATHALKLKDSATAIETLYILVRFTNEGYWNVGEVFDSAGTAMKLLAYVPPLQQMKFPLTYQTEWNSTSEVKTPFGFPGYVQTQTINAKVDGYGTLVVPTRAGKQPHDPSSATEVLRLETKLTNTTTVDPISFSTSSYSYQWMSMTAYGAYLYTDSNKTPMSVSYSTPTGSGSVDESVGNGLEIHIGANPVIAETEVAVMLTESSAIVVGVFDPFGREVTMIKHAGQVGQNRIPLSVHELANGTYFLRLDAGSHKAIRKIVVQR